MGEAYSSWDLSSLHSTQVLPAARLLVSHAQSSWSSFLSSPGPLIGLTWLRGEWSRGCFCPTTDVSFHVEMSLPVKPSWSHSLSHSLRRLEVESLITLVNVERMNWVCLARCFPHCLSATCHCYSQAHDKLHGKGPEPGGMVPGSCPSRGW